jgi:ATP-dependent exoDNAse (exonuclease V) beta subunit
MTGTTIPLADAEARHVIATALDATLLVEAAAGTGKTTELVGRIVRIIADDRAKVGEIVAVTFTEKAAGELKLRLRERLDAERSAAMQDAQRRARLDDALKQLEEAHVSTIHGFCADLLRERPVEAGVDPLFEVLTETASARLFDEAFGRWLQEQLARPGEGIRRALRRSSFGGDDGPVDRLRGAAWDLAQWRDFSTPWTREPFDRRHQIGRLITALHEFADLTRNPQSRNDPLHAGTEPARRLSDEIAVHQGFGDGAADALLDQWEAALVDLSRDRMLATVRQGRGTSYSDRVSRQRVLQALTELRAELDGFRLAADADLAALLQGELQGAIRRYETAKAAAGAVDFLDLLLGARNLIRDNPDVRRGFQQRFRRIFVDEFQDTDPLQAEILLLLAADDDNETDWRKARPAAGRLFLVGDPKQSIYRFRRADVGVYRDVCRQLEQQGATMVHLNTSFRSVPAIQACVNEAFAPIMTGDELTLQADYVPLARHRPAMGEQPAIVALPVPAPYAKRYISAAAIEKSLPDATAAFVDWIVQRSGWMVTERSGTGPVPVAAKHVCLLFRRFISFQTDVTRAYVDALEARGLPHVLVGGRAFHEREEVEAIRAAFAAIERPDDELSVFATLRGPFFAIGDEELLEWTSTFGQATGGGFRRHVFHPFRVPAEFANGDTPALDRLRPIASALRILRRLHMRRNYVPVAETLHALLDSTRAHVGFALRPGGEQALANVLHVAELARQYERDGGISFRGFVDELRTAAETAQAAEAPLLEEDSDGVRIMTVHKAKGLEFPIVMLADLTCKLSRAEAGRWIDPVQNICALKLGGWAPIDLLHHDAEEAAKDRAEAERLAYVAATRARDLLVVPVIGDEAYEGGWLSPLTPAVYPSPEARRTPTPAVGCPVFPSKDSVMNRPDGDPARGSTVAPGEYVFERRTPTVDRRALTADRRPPTADNYSVVWWDPHILNLGAGSPFGLRRDDLIAKDGEPAGSAARLATYNAWRAERDAIVAAAKAPSLSIRIASDEPSRHRAIDGEPVEIRIEDLARLDGRPFGPRFGTLVHATLATIPLTANEDVVRAVARTQARILLAAEEEADAASEIVSAALRHPLFDRVRAADRAEKCFRELPVLWRAPDGTLIEGTVDLAFEDRDGITVIDFKTGRELDADLERHKGQLTIYCRALAALRGGTLHGVIMRV